jgi:O-antigen/teichoic acid export membrane protein
VTSEHNQRATGPLSRLWHAFDGLAGDTLWSAGLDLLSVATALVSFLLLQQVLLPEEYGAFAGLYGLATIFSAITYSGPGLALVQRHFRYREDPDRIQASFLSLTLLAGVASSVVAVVLALFIIHLSVLEIVLITASELFANSIIWVVSWLVQVRSGFPAMIRVRMMAVLLKLCAVPALFLADQLTILNLGLAYLLLYGVLAAWLVFVHLPRIGYRVSFCRPSEDVWRSSAVFAVPLAASQVQLDGDKVALNAFNLQADAGLYAAAYRVVLLGSLPIRVIGQAAFHRFLDYGDDSVDGFHLRRAGRLTGFMFLVGLASAGVIYAVLYLFEPVIDLLIEENFEGAKEIIPWLVLFIPLLAISGTPLNGLLGLGRTRERANVYLSSAFVSVVLYATLIPWLGWPGAVASTLASEAYLAIVSWGAMVHYQRIADRERSGAGRTSQPSGVGTG